MEFIELEAKSERKLTKHLVRISKEGITDGVKMSWAQIAPTWPINEMVAVNPLAGFISLPFEVAIQKASSIFQMKEIPTQMLAVNRQTIKWLQAFFDEGQASIAMPNREQGLYLAFLQVALFDDQLHGQDEQRIKWLADLPTDSEKVLEECLSFLKIEESQVSELFTFLLSSLPGWASFIQYRTSWYRKAQAYPLTKEDYLALRLVILCLLWPNFEIADCSPLEDEPNDFMEKVIEKENEIQQKHLACLDPFQESKQEVPDAQFVFCIDVRSEPFRRALEQSGKYQTFGFAGFFGLPVEIEDPFRQQTRCSCPVLVAPQHQVSEHPVGNEEAYVKGVEKRELWFKIYQSVKYTFTTPLLLAEFLGMLSGLWMGLRTLFPGLADRFKNAANKTMISSSYKKIDLEKIPVGDRVVMAENGLRMMGLIDNFAPYVVFCGHGSKTQNNPFASSLDCGACGGNHGGANAQLLAQILNEAEVRQQLKENGIMIPESTLFLGAEHCTTTDELVLFADEKADGLKKIRMDLVQAKRFNQKVRALNLLVQTKERSLDCRSQDWAEVRPEWGLAKNATFIIGPRSMSQNSDLEGRAFLHSYNWKIDENGNSLRTILTAPMVVAHWINMQYFFSTLDPVAFGAGSKVTQNIVGKMGVIQGNASDLMHGLPLQSVSTSDDEAYHIPVRLSTIVVAPKERILPIIKEEKILQDLFRNEWVFLYCMDPTDQTCMKLDKNLQEFLSV